MERVTFGSLFAGIGGFDLGFERAGMRCSWQVEWDTKCQKLLCARFPHAELHGDVRKVYGRQFGAVDLICGGFPCQDVSVAGRRKGLAGERSGLWFEFARILGECRPTWVVIENVPGLLSSNQGMDFAVILQGLEELGYGVAWRILDAQYFGVAQRRRRVFIIGHLGDGRAAEVLFEPESLRRDSPPSRPIGQDDFVFDWQSGGDARGLREQKTAMLHASQVPAVVQRGMVGIRRLTPTECERLQGFPDGWTEGFANSARYRMLGNAVAVPVAEWIGRRIKT